LNGSSRQTLNHAPMRDTLLFNQAVEIGFREDQIGGFSFAEFTNGISMPHLALEILHLAFGQRNKNVLFIQVL